MPTRYPGLDVARAVAIFLVVLHHAWTMMGGQMGTSSAIELFYANVAMNVPLFVMISGALQMTPRPAVEYWKKRFPRVWLPYLFWGSGVYLISCVLGKYPEIHSLAGAAASYVPYMLDFGKVNAAYWFIGLISLLYLVTPLLHLFIPRLPENGVLVLVGIWLAWMLAKDIFQAGSLPFAFDTYIGTVGKC